MKIWLNTLDEGAIKTAQEMGILSGVTTNYEMLYRSPLPLYNQLQRLLDAQEGPLAVQVLAEQKEAMVEQAEKFVHFSPRIIVKIPGTPAGFSAVRELSKRQIPTMVTAVFHPKQALLAALAGADFVAPFFQKMEECGSYPEVAVPEMAKLLKAYESPTKLIVASLRRMSQVTFCYQHGADAVTIGAELFRELIDPPKETLDFTKEVKKLYPDLKIG